MLLRPPAVVVPKRLPEVSKVKPAHGAEPSLPELKLCSTFSVCAAASVAVISVAITNTANTAASPRKSFLLRMKILRSRRCVEWLSLAPSDLRKRVRVRELLLWGGMPIYNEDLVGVNTETTAPATRSRRVLAPAVRCK